MKKISTLIISSLIFCSFVVVCAQTTENNQITWHWTEEDLESKADNQFCIADIDMDGVTDTLRYDFDKAQFTFLLSSRDFVPYIQASYDLREGGEWLTITAYEGGLGISFQNNTRSWSNESYIYDHEKQRFRFTYFSFESYGDAYNFDNENECCWSYHMDYSLDLLTEEFKAALSYHRLVTDSLISYPDISVYVHNIPIYLGDSTEWYMPDSDFFEKYRQKYSPAQIDTITFLGHNVDYDYWSVIGEKDGEYYSVVGYLGDVNRDDVIALSTATSCYQEAGDHSVFGVFTSEAGYTKIKEGKLSQFYRNNKKEINRHGSPSTYYGSHKCEADIDYFFANTTDSRLLSYFKRRGSFEVRHTEHEDDINDSDIYGAEYITISHKYKGKEQLICKLILSYGNDIVQYYMLDEKSKTYQKIDM